MFRSAPSLCGLIAVCSLLAALLPPSAEASPEAPLKKLLVERNAALVNVKFTVKVAGGGAGPRDVEGEVGGVLVDPTGLVLTSNARMGGLTKGASPLDIKVLIGDDEDGQEASIVTRDTELDLVWIRLKKAPAKPLPFVDLDQSVKATLGMKLLAVRQMSKYFGREPVVSESQVGAVTHTPRSYIVPGTQLATGANMLGAPVFSEDGKLVGVLVVPVVDEGQGARLAPVAAADVNYGLVLPASEVAKATKLAREVASAEAPATQPAP